MTKRFRMLVAYDGAAYAGWQVQPGERTIQGELERVVTEITGETQRVHCSGRTDAGVHAKGQVAHFDLASEMAPKRLMGGMNALLDKDIRIHRLGRCAADFHARFNAREKEYRYFIWNGEVVPPFVRAYRAHVKEPLDAERMSAAAELLVGEHDFAAFSANPNREVDGTVRFLKTLDVRRRGRVITIIARGDGFLYKMVRSLAGFLVRVGSGAEEPAVAGEILASRTRTARVPTAAPEGLFLWRVYY